MAHDPEYRDNPYYYGQLLTQTEVDEGLSLMACEIAGDYDDSPRIIAIRMGAIRTAGVLIRELLTIKPHFQPRLLEVRVSTVAADGSFTEPYFTQPIPKGVNFRGENVLIVDGMCDRGKTLGLVYDEVYDRHAFDIASAVTIDRVGQHAVGMPQPTYRAFELHSDKWVYGCDLDDKRMGGDGGRRAPGIYLNYTTEQFESIHRRETDAPAS